MPISKKDCNALRDIIIEGAHALRDKNFEEKGLSHLWYEESLQEMGKIMDRLCPHKDVLTNDTTGDELRYTADLIARQTASIQDGSRGPNKRHAARKKGRR